MEIPYEVAPKKKHRKTTLILAVALVVSWLLSNPVSACYVTYVHLDIGCTEDVAHEEGLVLAHVGRPIYFCIEWQADGPDDEPFGISFWHHRGDYNWKPLAEDIEETGTKRHVDISCDLSYSNVDYWIKVKVRRKNVSDGGEYSNICRARVVQVSYVAADKDVACTNEQIGFTVHTDPTASWYSGFVWTATYWPGDEVYTNTNYYSWPAAAVGTQTVTASLGNTSASKDVEIIDGLTVIPRKAYVPVNGTKDDFEAWRCEGGEAVKKTSGVSWNCSRGDFIGNTYYAPQTPSTGEGSDSVTATYGGQTTDDTHDCDLTVFRCDVTSADVTQDKIHVNLEPSGLSGTLKLELTGPGSSHTIREVTMSSGSYDETFDIPNLTAGEYTKVKATWTIESNSSIDEYDYHIKVLGNFDHTWYNCPVENTQACQGPDEIVCITDSNCNYTTGVTMEKEFLDETDENGTGNATNYDYITREQWCQTHGYPPPPACEGKRIYREVSSVKGACGTVLIADHDIATDWDEVPDLSCGTKVYIEQLGVRYVNDKCPGGGTTKIDHYYGESGCDVVPGTIPDKKVIILYD